jgi:hypothetical protein
VPPLIGVQKRLDQARVDFIESWLFGLRTNQAAGSTEYDQAADRDGDHQDIAPTHAVPVAQQVRQVRAPPSGITRFICVEPVTRSSRTGTGAFGRFVQIKGQNRPVAHKRTSRS